jgi:gas vesicle protein
MKLTRLLAFAAIGTAVGLLLTTKKGKELRKDVADRSGDLLQRLNKLSKQTISDLQDVASTAKADIEETAKSAKKTAKQYV